MKEPKMKETERSPWWQFDTVYDREGEGVMEFVHGNQEQPGTRSLCCRGPSPGAERYRGARQYRRTHASATAVFALYHPERHRPRRWHAGLASKGVRDARSSTCAETG